MTYEKIAERIRVIDDNINGNGNAETIGVDGNGKGGAANEIRFS